MKRSSSYAVLVAMAVSGAVGAQSTGGMSPSSSGSAAAGGSPVGRVLPYTVQSGSTAPTLPGHTMTAEHRSSSARTAGNSGGEMAPAPAESADAKSQARDTSNRGYLARSDVQDFNGISFEDVDATKYARTSREEVANAPSAKASQR